MYRIIRGSFAPRRHDFLVRVSKIFLFTVCSIPMSLPEKKQSLTLNHKPQVGPQTFKRFLKKLHHYPEMW